MSNKEKTPTAMFGSGPQVQIGKLFISEFSEPPGDSVWIKTAEGEGGQFRKDKLAKILELFFDENM